MRKMFIKHLIIVMTCAMIGIIAANIFVTDKLAERYTFREAKTIISQVESRIESNNTDMAETKKLLETDYLTRCKAFRYMVELDPELLTSHEKILGITELLSVDELNVIDESGIIINGTNPDHYGYDMASAEQSKVFLSLFDSEETEIVQEIMPKGYNGEEFQYVGVITNDKKYILQVGMKPERYISAIEKSALSGFLSESSVTTKEGCYVFIIDDETRIYLDHTDKSLIGTPVTSDERDEDFYDNFNEGGIYTYLGTKYYMYTADYDNKIIGVTYEYNSVMGILDNMRMLTVMSIIAMFIIVIVIISILVDRRIVSPIENIISDMNEISEGNIKKYVTETDLPELKKLSSGINNMKQSVINETNKISEIISATDIPIVVYEIDYMTEKCTVLGNFRKLYGLSEDEEKELFNDNKKLMKFLSLTTHEIEDGEENVYKLKDKNRWIKVDKIDELGNAFCIVTDATDFIIDKKRIKSERDIDALTGIYNRRSFEKYVSLMITKKNPGKVSAMLMIDLDDFKSINDTYGHAFGDTYLKFTASALNTFVGENVIAGRRSGDEFYMFFDSFSSKEEIISLIDSVYEYIRNNPMDHQGKKVPVKFSAGASFLTDKTDSFDLLLEKADARLYKAKKENKGNFISK